MLKHIPKILSPDLLKILMEMGHGDEIVIADGNYPAASTAQRLVRYDGVGVPPLLASIIQLFPLDSYSDSQVLLMEVVKGDNYTPEIWEDYKKILNTSGEKYNIEFLERFRFYERAKRAYAVVATGETSLYSNIILKKGVVR